MDHVIEATMHHNIVCINLVKRLTTIPTDLQEMVLQFVGVFEKCNELRQFFLSITGTIDFRTGKFHCFSGPGYRDTLTQKVRDTVCFIDDVFCYNPYHVWSEMNERKPRELATDVVCELTSPRGDGTLTYGEILNFVLKCELEHRPNTRWFGIPDHSHIYFENFEVSNFDDISMWATNPAPYFPQAEYTTVWNVFWGS